MSFTDQSTDAVQPEQGQGGDGATDAPYSEYLARIPEEVRGDVEPVFKDWDANVTRRFQDAAEYRSRWEPFESIGVHNMQPDQVQWALQVAQAAQENPQALREWLDQTHGPVAAPQTQPEPDPFAYQDPSQQQLEKLLEEKLGPVSQQLEQFSQWRQQLEQQARESQIAEQINSEVAALKTAEAASLPEGVRQNFESYIEKFAMPYAEAGADPKTVVAKAWQDLRSFSNEIERAALQGKVDAPAPPEGGGVPDVNPPQYKSIMDPNLQEAAKEFLRNNRG